MRTVKITTPENIEIEYRLAGLGSRAAAVVVDLFIQIAAILVIAVTIIAFKINPKELLNEYEGWLIGAIILIIWIIIYGYFIIFEMAMNGRTPGKKLFNLRTIRNNGQPITIKHSVIRNLFRIIIDIYGIGIVLMFFSSKHKRVGDYVASTMVVVEEKKEIPIALEINHYKKYNYKYSISKVEYQLLKKYFHRKDDLGENVDKLEKKLGEYFAEKLEVTKNESEYAAFLNELLEYGSVYN